MRLTVLAAVSLLAVAAAGCTNETLDTFDKADVDLKRVSSKTNYQLSPSVLSKMSAMNMDRASPIMLRIFKEEGRLEVWKADRSNRFQQLRSYKICAWSGKLGPKMKEGDRQAPEGFYPLSKANLNPNSSYFLAINTGFPNSYDRAQKASGTNLMIHGACSSSGCYSMTDEQMLEIFAFARDAFGGGQSSIQLQAFPFRMTAENMARHRDNPNIEFWKMLKVGYDHFEVTKRPPEVNVCEKKYVFNQQTEGGSFNASAQCPAMSTPPALVSALSSYEKTYDLAYEKAMKKYDGMAWYDPSEAERKALVAEKRKGREPAYAPTGSALKAGKLMKETEYAALMEKKAQQVTTSSPATTATASSLRGPRPSAVQPATAPQSNPAPAAPTMVASATPAAAGQTGAAAPSIPVPAMNPLAYSAAPAPEAPEKKPFWKFWAKE